METDNEYLITEEEFKTLDTDNIFEILLNDGTKLKFNKNTNKSICTCNKYKNITRNSNSSLKEKNKFSSFTNKKEFYVIPIPNAKPKLILNIILKLSHLNLSQKNISINLINHQREKIHQELNIKEVLICVLVLAHVLIRIDYIALVENITKLYK